jgi:hypothetical protein
MRGKTSPRGATPARDNTGSQGKTGVLVAALKRVTAALRTIGKAAAPRRSLPARSRRPGRLKRRSAPVPGAPHRKACR